MGAMHDTFKPVTAKDIAKREKVDIATIRFRWNKAFAKGTFDSNRELSPEEVEIISQSTKGRTAKKVMENEPVKKTVREALPEAKKDFRLAVEEFKQQFPTDEKEMQEIDDFIRKTQPYTVNQPAPAVEAIPPAPGRAKFEWPTFGLSEFLALAVYGHTALVWYEVWVIFQVPGILAGVVLFALKHAAVVICRNEKFSDYTSDALGVAFVLDALAVWVHYTAFGDAMPARFKDGAEFWAALVLGLVVASGAFMSLYFTSKTANK